jgi:hypothetical protein
MSSHILDEAIIASLEPLFLRARAEQLWFFHHTPDDREVWLSPDALTREQAEGRWMLPAELWELRPPVGYMKKLAVDAQRLVDRYNQVADELGYEQRLTLDSLPE